jgi:hypothetical protein
MSAAVVVLRLASVLGDLASCSPTLLDFYGFQELPLNIFRQMRDRISLSPHSTRTQCALCG